MKNVFKKFLVLSAVISLAFTGCNDIADFGGSNEENVIAHAAGKAVLSLSVNQNPGRTIMPTNISEADVTKIELTAKKIGSDGEETDYKFQLDESSKARMVEWFSEDGEDGKTAIENMQDSSVTIDWGTYNFTLNLYTGESSLLRLTQIATLKNQEINSSTTSLSFEAKYVEKGDLSLTLKADSETSKEISGIKAAIFTMASKGEMLVDGYDYTVLSTTGLQADGNTPYVLTDVPNGTYYLKIKIYGLYGGNEIGTITDVVKIYGYKTEKEITLSLEELNVLYSVSYDLNSNTAEWKQDVEENLTTKRNIYTGVTLPTNIDIKYTGYKLLGWCEKDSDGNPIDADGDGETDIITTISTGIDTAKDYTLYAVWEKEEANVEFDISIKVGEKNEISAEYETDDSVISFTVTPPDAEATYTYTWTVDDDEQEPTEDPTFEIDASNWTTGVYDISFIAKEVKDDKETYYSYMAQIEWTKKFKVEFDISNAPTGTEPIEPLYVAENAETKTITAPTDVTPTFGWYTDSEFKEEFDFTKPITSSITLYGCWDLNGAIYVSENGTDGTDCGTIGRPLASIAGAVALMTDENVDYTIYVTGELTDAQEIKSTSGVRAHSITLVGMSGVDSNNVPKDSLNGGFSETTPGRTLTVNTTVPVTIENLVVTGGYFTDSGSFGGGLYVASGADVTLAGHTKITGNTAVRGGGVDVDGTLTMIDDASIHGNTATASYGGGATVGSNGVLDMQSGEIYGNDISGGETKQGYGVYVSGSSGRLKMGGSAIIGSSEDTVPNDVYLSSGTKIIVTAALIGGETVTIKPSGYDETVQWIEVEEGCTAELATECSSFVVTPLRNITTTTYYAFTAEGKLVSGNTTITEAGDYIQNLFVNDTVTVVGRIEGSELTEIFNAIIEKDSIEVALDLSGVTGLSELPDEAFAGCTALVSISLPEGLASIGESAFSGCASLSEVTLPATLDSIASDAFSGTVLTTVNYRGTEEQRLSVNVADDTIAGITWTCSNSN